jgi:hypothetical protein
VRRLHHRKGHLKSSYNLINVVVCCLFYLVRSSRISLLSLPENKSGLIAVKKVP